MKTLGSPAADTRPLLELVRELGALVGIGPACDALGISRATFYRARKSAADRAEFQPKSC